MYRLTKIVFLALIILPISAMAQFNQIQFDIPYALSNELNVEIIPTYIRPYEQVYINLTIYTADLDSADILWLQDGKEVLVGKGIKSHSFTAKGPGEKTDIEIRARLNDGTIFNKKFSLTPTSVDTLWEAQGYTPPFYKGKTLHAKQGILKVVAMPEFYRDGVRVDPSKLIYNWSNGVEGYVEQSGYGRQTLVISGSLLGKTDSIEVLVKDPNSNLAGEAFIDIPTITPEIVFYEYSPYYGHMYNQSLGSSREMEKDEMQIIASPYFFSDVNNLKFSWALNGNDAQDLSDFRSVLFRKPEEEKGESLVSLSISNPFRILQLSEKNISLRFK